MIDVEEYERAKAGTAYKKLSRGLFAVTGSEAVKFLNGMVTNDVAKLDDGTEMRAAFPNAQGRLIALVRLRRDGEKILIETEEATREKLFQNLFRFTFAGEFFLEDLSEKYDFYQNFGSGEIAETGDTLKFGDNIFFPKDLPLSPAAYEISDELYELLRIERGIPLFGVDCDENTIVPELGQDMISYNKGCYIGQEIIARIHFRGHVAKALRLLEIAYEGATLPDEIDNKLTSLDGKPAGIITSIASKDDGKGAIALGFVRYEFLSNEAELITNGASATLRELPKLLA